MHTLQSNGLYLKIEEKRKTLHFNLLIENISSFIKSKYLNFPLYESILRAIRLFIYWGVIVI